jgi:hypothetical protein
MSAAGLAGPVVAATEVVSWRSLGLVACLVGCFLLANGVVLRDPRALIAQRFSRSLPPLRSARELVFHRVQTGLGFLFLIAGFAAQLVDSGAEEPSGVPGSIALWVGGLLVLAIVLEGLGWWWSLHAIRRHVRELLGERPPDLAADVHLARELGELFGVRTHADDTVQAYLERLAARIGVALPTRPSGRAATRPLDLDEPPPEPQPPPAPPQPAPRQLPRLR